MYPYGNGDCKFNSILIMGRGLRCNVLTGMTKQTFKTFVWGEGCWFESSRGDLGQDRG